MKEHWKWNLMLLVGKLGLYVSGPVISCRAKPQMFLGQKAATESCNWSGKQGAVVSPAIREKRENRKFVCPAAGSIKGGHRHRERPIPYRLTTAFVHLSLL